MKSISQTETMHDRMIHALRVAEDLAAAIQDRIEAMRLGQRPANWPTVFAAEAALRDYREFALSIPKGTPLRDEALLHAAADWRTR